MRRPFRSCDAESLGWTESSLRWAVRVGRLMRLEQGVYLEAGATPTATEEALGRVVAVDGIATGWLAATLMDLDGIRRRGPVVTVPSTTSSARRAVRRYDLPPEHVIELNGYRCTDGLWTLLDLARALDDLQWEQALESALRKQLTSIADVQAILPALGAERFSGVGRVRRVLTLRPDGAPATESLLETLMVQLIRRNASLPEPKRQVWVANRSARVDLCWPVSGVFVELDGEHHKAQPLYDASRETAVVAATGWLPARFTWTEVVHHPTATLRRLRSILDRAAERTFHADMSA